MKTITAIIICFCLGFIVGQAQNPQWVVYNTSNSGIQSNGISGIAIDLSGNKWVSSYGDGVSKFNDTNWQVYTSSNGLPFAFNVTSAITIDEQNNKWVGGAVAFADQDYGVAMFDDSNWTFHTMPPNMGVKSILPGVGGEVWVGTTGGGLAHFDGVTWTVYNTFNSGLPGNNINTLAIGTNGNIWIGTHYNGLARFDGVNWTVYDTVNSGLPVNTIYSLAIDGAENKWIGTYSGLAKFDGASWVVFDTINSGLPGNNVMSITIEGNIKWIGTRKMGLAKYDDVDWAVYDTDNSGLPNNNVISIVVDGNENKWIGTNVGGVAVFNELGVGIEGVSDKTSLQQLAVYPNPVSQVITIRYVNSSDDIARLALYDMNGRIIDVLTDGTVLSGQHTMDYNTDKLQSGVYYLRLQTEDYSSTHKLIVTK